MRMNRLFNTRVFHNLWLLLLEYPFSIIFAAVSITLILIVAYFFGSALLLGQLPGGDTPVHITYLDWFARYYPQIPWWYPLQGGGQSLTAGYYPLPYYLVIFLTKILPLTLYQSFRFVAFSTVVVIAIEIYFYCWIRLKNQFIALLGSVFFLLSSGTWGFMTDAGFFTFFVSLIFIVPSILFYELFLERFLEKGGRLTIVWFWLASTFFGLSIISHLSVGATVGIAMAMITLFRTVFFSGWGRIIFKKFFKGFLALFLVSVVALLLVSPFFLPVRVYLNYVQSKFSYVFSVESTDEVPIKSLLGIEPTSTVGSLYRAMFFSFPVILLSGLGLVAAVLKRHKILSIGLAAALLFLYIANTKTFASISFLAQVLVLPTAMRAIYFPMIFLPVLAAFGVWSLAYLPGSVVEIILKLFKVKAGIVYSIVRRVFWLIAIPLALGGSLLIIYNFRSYQVRAGDDKAHIEAYNGYGPSKLPVPFCELPNWGLNSRKCDKLNLSPKINSDPADSLAASNIDQVVKDLKLGYGTRVDFSPRLGDIIRSFNRHSDASMLESYQTQVSANLSYLGYKVRTFYEKEGKPNEANELAKWFGVTYLFLNPGSDDLKKYQEPDWTKVATLGFAPVYRFNESRGLVSLEKKPTVLVIGNTAKNAYEGVFRVAFKGALSYDEAWLIEGKEKIDSYSIDDLRQYKLLILNGYSYSNKNKAWNLIKDYVEGGGKVFIDTGWQFVAKDWGKGPDKKGNYSSVDLPEPSPVQKTSWGTLPKSWREAKLDLEDKTISLKEFGETTWQGNILWGASLAEKNNLRPGSKPILTVGDKVIIASRKVGEGEIIWSGMNLITHSYDKKSDAEINFLHALLSDGFVKETSPVSLTEQRGFPDQKKFVLGQDVQNASLLVKENYTPDWKATLISNGKKMPLKIYRAGPGEMLTSIPEAKSGDEVLFEYTLKKYFNLGILISSLTLLVLFLIFFDSLIFRSALLSAIKKRIRSLISPIKRRLEGLKLNIGTSDDE